MAITAMHYKKIEYFRITRTWEYKKVAIQQYVRIKTHKNRDKNTKLREAAFQEAVGIDKLLRGRQKANYLSHQNDGQIYFHPTGKIVGINRIFCHRTRALESGEPVIYEVHDFTVRYNNLKGIIKNTSVSIFKYGLDEAYELAVEKFLYFIKESNNKPLHKLMLKSIAYYQNDPTLENHKFAYDGRGKIDVLPLLSERIKLTFDTEKSGQLNRKPLENTAYVLETIEKSLKKEIADFTDRSRGAINAI